MVHYLAAVRIQLLAGASEGSFTSDGGGTKITAKAFATKCIPTVISFHLIAVVTSIDLTMECHLTRTDAH
jgi:hypothetical protein